MHYSEQEFANSNLVALTSMQGVVEVLKIDNLKELTEEWETGTPYSNKNKKYNSLNLLYFCLNIPGAKPTVEFRQHESTVDVKQIIQRNKVIVGIVNFVHTEGETSLVKLFQGAVEEGNWTAIDLLRYIRLCEKADFYSNRLHKVSAKPDGADGLVRNRGYRWE